MALAGQVTQSTSIRVRTSSRVEDEDIGSLLEHRLRTEPGFGVPPWARGQHSRHVEGSWSTRPVSRTSLRHVGAGGPVPITGGSRNATWSGSLVQRIVRWPPPARPEVGSG